MATALQYEMELGLAILYQAATANAAEPSKARIHPRNVQQIGNPRENSFTKLNQRNLDY